MGSKIAELARSNGKFQVVYGLDKKPSDVPGGASWIGADTTRINQSDVVIDFTAPDASLAIAKQVARYGKAYVLGTTGFSPAQESELKNTLRKTAVVKSANMSLGVNVLFKMANLASKALSGFDVKIIEAHHAQKKDKPSGTALQAGKLMEKHLRKPIQYESIREGEIVGDHRIIFSSPDDQLEIFHHAVSRDIFARGALVAAEWIAKQKKPGFYSMQDVLGLDD
jgi:4-hydroxy-tetrahydrodipicolinate reductase